MKRQVSYFVDDATITVDIEGETSVGTPQVLLDQEDDLTASTSWHKSGYIVAPFLTQNENDELRAGLRKILHGLVDTITRRHVIHFDPENYHNYIGSDENHLALTREIKDGFAIRLLPIDIKKIEKRISDLCCMPVISICPSTEEPIFNVRVVRPHKNDNNPPSPRRVARSSQKFYQRLFSHRRQRPRFRPSPCARQPSLARIRYRAHQRGRQGERPQIHCPVGHFLRGRNSNGPPMPWSR